MLSPETGCSITVFCNASPSSASELAIVAAATRATARTMPRKMACKRGFASRKSLPPETFFRPFWFSNLAIVQCQPVFVVLFFYLTVVINRVRQIIVKPKAKQPRHGRHGDECDEGKRQLRGNRQRHQHQ